LADLADQVVAQLAAAGFDVLYDDRVERAGVKFKDADLVGIPVRVAVGGRGLGDGTVEWKLRTQSAAERIPVSEVGARAAGLGFDGGD
jgi:prolyl-tRNA synthetase